MEWKVKSAQKMTRLLLFLGLILFWLTACTMGQLSNEPKARDCSRLQEPDLRSLEFGKLRSAEMHKWLKESSPFRGTRIAASPGGSDSSSDLRWEYDQVIYNASFSEDLLTKITIIWGFERETSLLPTANEVLSCFGHPEEYWAVRDINESGEYIDLSLWYLKKGLVISSENLYYKDSLPAIDGKVRMTTIIMFAPGKKDEVIKDIYSYAPNDFYAEVLNVLYDWPGYWEAVKVRGCFNIKNCPH